MCWKCTKVLGRFWSCGCIILCIGHWLASRVIICLVAACYHMSAWRLHAPPSSDSPELRHPRHVLWIIMEEATYHIHHKVETYRTQTLTGIRFLGPPGPAAHCLGKTDSFQQVKSVFRNLHQQQRKICYRAVRPVDTSVSCAWLMQEAMPDRQRIKPGSR